MSIDKPLLNSVIEADLPKRVDDFRFKNRFDSRAAAIKWLQGWALDQKPTTKGMSMDAAKALKTAVALNPPTHPSNLSHRRRRIRTVPPNFDRKVRFISSARHKLSEAVSSTSGDNETSA
jgi:hypothetical protein